MKVSDAEAAQTPIAAFLQGLTLLAQNKLDPAANAFRWQMADTLPAIELTSVYEGNSEDWTPQKDLLNSDSDKSEFVAEIENDGTAHVRFGDNEHGRRSDSSTTFTAAYRVGNGVAGNVGADSLVHIVSDDSRITSVRNPIAAHGGVEALSRPAVPRDAPGRGRGGEGDAAAARVARPVGAQDRRVGLDLTGLRRGRRQRALGEAELGGPGRC